jgi:cyclase
MGKVRIIPRMDIKGPNLVKGIHLEGLRIIGDPQVYAQRYCDTGADELLYVDIVASLYGRNNLSDIVSRAAKNISIPLTVAGGVRTLDDIKTLLRAGADKVSINTAAVEDPTLIQRAVKHFGSQCIVVAIDYKLWPDGSFLNKKDKTVSRTSVGSRTMGGSKHFQVYTDNGRQQTGLEVYEWALKAVEMGAGELLLTSIDKEGIQKGYELELSRKIAEYVTVPVVSGGGAGTLEHIKEAITVGMADAITTASLLHYDKTTVNEIKAYLAESNIKTANHSWNK